MRDENSLEYYKSQAIYYENRSRELESERDEYVKEAKYYQEQLAKSHEILGRVIHQLSERWDSVNLTKYYPTDNLNGLRRIGKRRGIMEKIKTIRYRGMDNIDHVIVADKIVRLSKDWERDITFIHLSNGEIIPSKDSIKTLEARLNL